MNRAEEKLLAEARQEFTERMLSQHLPQTEEQKERARQVRKKLDKKFREFLVQEGYDLKELGIKN